MARRFTAACAVLGALSLASIADRARAQPATTSPQGTLVIVHSPALAQSAVKWAEYRSQRGWSAVRIEIAARSESEADAQRDAIRTAIRGAHAKASPSKADDFAVLLLGDDDALPAWRFAQIDPLVMDDDRQYISDLPYQLADDKDEVPDFPLGRVPARSNADAEALLTKVATNEASAALAGSDWGGHTVTYVAGEGHFGAMDTLLETLFVMMVDRFVPAAFDLSMTYAKSSSIYCPPPSQLSATVLERMREGGVLFNYVGHGFERGLDSLHWNGKRIPILRTDNLEALNVPAGTTITQRPVAFMSCCSVGHFDMPGGERSFSEAMLFHPAGPIAVISGSRITHPYPNTILQKDITHALLVDRAPTAGMLDYMADRSLLKQDADDRELDAIATLIARQMKWVSSLRDLRIMHARMYNLLGDPASEIALTEMGVKKLSLRDGMLTGTAQGMRNGTAIVRIETQRAMPARSDRLQTINGDNDPDLESKAAQNYPLANDRLLVEVRSEFTGDRFEIALPNPLPAGAAVIRVRIEGVDAGGARRGQIGAMRLSQN